MPNEPVERHMERHKRKTIGLIVVAALIVGACCSAPNKRNAQARAFFMQHNPCPSTGKTKGACPGYVVDHVVAIKHGGGDNPLNMQWQTVQDAKEKDRWE